MWSSIFKAISGAIKVASPLIQAGATIYAAGQQRKAAETTAAAMSEASRKAQKQQSKLMGEVTARAGEQEAAIASQTQALTALLKEREAKTAQITKAQEEQKKRQRRSLVHTTKETWYGAAPLIKPAATNALSPVLGG